MRTILMPFLAVVAIVATGANTGYAQNRRFCTQTSIFSGGWPHCAYDTFEQCRATASGTGAYCVSNPWYVEPEKPVKARKKRAKG